MAFHDWLLFAAIAFVATITPGPAVLLVTSHSVAHGWRHAVLAILGNVSGLFVMSALSVLGLGAVIVSSAGVFELIRLLGAAYLVFLGVKLWRNGFGVLPGEPVRTRMPRTAWRTYMQGLAVALSNPKAIAFTTALFPQFIDREMGLAWQFSVLVITFMGLSFSCLLAYALLVARAREQLAGSLSGKLSKGFGGAFIASGIALASTARGSA